MAESVYKVVELVGTSSESWEKATAAAVSEASKTLRDLRIAEISPSSMVRFRDESGGKSLTDVVRSQFNRGLRRMNGQAPSLMLARVNSRSNLPSL